MYLVALTLACLACTSSSLGLRTDEHVQQIYAAVERETPRRVTNILSSLFSLAKYDKMSMSTSPSRAFAAMLLALDNLVVCWRVGGLFVYPARHKHTGIDAVIHKTQMRKKIAIEKAASRHGHGINMAMPIVILGGGIIGSSIAYYLAQAGVACTVVEQNVGPASGASGRAAGFLAGSWGDGQLTERLHRTSFAMHEELATSLGLSSYRKLPTYKVSTSSDIARRTSVVEGHAGPAWLDGVEVESAVLLDAQTAQVDPAELSQAFLSSAIDRGATLVTATVTGIDTTSDKDTPGNRRVTAVILEDGRRLEAEQICIALGPWSCIVEEWLGVPLPLEGILSSSAIWKHASSTTSDLINTSPASLFCEEDERGCRLEVHPRPNGDVYVCGCGNSRIIPGADLISGIMPPASAAQPDNSRVAAAERTLAGLSLGLNRSSDVRQACMRPCSPDGKPLLGALPGVEGVYVATGHNAWGITWAPVTGRAMAELLLEGDARTVNLKPFSPRRFDTMVQRQLMRQRGKRVRGEAVGEQW